MADRFLDTSVLFDVVAGDERALPMVSDRFGTSLLNLWELHHVVLRSSGSLAAASLAFDRYRKHCVPITDSDFKDASEFRHVHKKRGLSYIDALGYVVARKHGAVFVTGDKGFTGLPGVELMA